MPDFRDIIKALIAGPESEGKMYDSKGKLLKNKMGSSALGKYQIVDSTWNKISKQYRQKSGRDLKRNSLADNETAMNILLDNYQKDLRSNGVPINPTTLYAMHFKGNAKWVKTAIKNPNLPANAVFSSDEIKLNPTYIPSGNIPLGKVMQTLNSKINTSAKKMNIPQQNFNYQTPSKMNELDPELIKKLGLSKVPDYTNPRGIWGHWKTFTKNREWIKKNKPDQEKALIKFYADKGYITRNADGDPDGPFNRLIIDKKNAEEKKLNGGISSSRKDVTELFNVANNLEKILGTSWYNGNKQRYSAADDGQFLNKENGFTSDKYLTPEQKKAVDKIMKPFSKAGKRKASDTFVNEKGTSAYNTVQFVKALETNLNKHLSDDQKVDLINEETGKRGKDLAFNPETLSHFGKSNKISAGKIYIPDRSDLTKSRVLSPTENLLPENTYDYIDPGYDDPAIPDDANYDFNQWNDDGSDMPNAPEFSDFNYGKFQYKGEDIRNSPNFEKFKAISKLTGIALTKENMSALEEKAKEYDQYEEKQDLNGYLTNLQNLADNLPETTNKGYDPKTQKGEFPFLETATSLFGILSGNNMANTELPERNEQVSDLFRNFTAEIKKLSEIGLRPEDEAYAKNMLSESYQANLDMIQRASNGNRNIVLGNLGRLDYQKQKGLMDLAVADSRAKTEALFKYGEAVKYISEFDANRDIANNERAYQNAMMTKQAGGQLAAQSWANLMDNIQYYKENKPGSANAMLKSHYMRNMYDVDPNETDPTNYYHPDNAKKRAAELENYRNNVTTINNTIQSLPEEDQKFFFQYAQKKGNDFNNNNVIGYAAFLRDNPGDKGNLNLSKINEAESSNNYSVLFDAMNSKNPTTINKGMIESAKTETAIDNQPSLYKSSTPQSDPNITIPNSSASFLNSDYSKAFDSERALFESGIIGLNEGNEMIDKYNLKSFL